MCRLSLRLLSVHLAIALIPTVAAALGQPPEVNEFGMPVRTAGGAPIVYTREQITAQASIAPSAPPSRASSASEKARAARWGYAVFGAAIGECGIESAVNHGRTELYVCAGSAGTYGGNDFWYALTYDAASASYQQIYVSELLPGARRLLVADVLGGPAPEIVLFLYDGRVRIYDLGTKALVSSFQSLASSDYSRAMGIADLDGDGANEIVLANDSALYVYKPDGTLLWSVPGAWGRDLVIAQMDGDPALEIALTSGSIVDAATHAIDWQLPYSDFRRLDAADIDGDGMAELIASEPWYSVYAFDVDEKATKWTIRTSHDIDAIHVSDFDDDGTLEVLVGDGQFGQIQAFDALTTQSEWSVYNVEDGVTEIAVVDSDGDGKKEVIWGAGQSSSGSDYLCVVDRESRLVEWKNVDLDGPFLGPAIGDLDGDGVDEIVALSRTSNSGYSGGSLVVLDGITHRCRAVSPVVGISPSTGAHDVRLADVDGDGREEILIASDYAYGGIVEIYHFNADNTFERIWTNATRPAYTPFESVAFLDLDGDGVAEVVVGSTGAVTAQGPQVLVYDFTTGAEKLRSPVYGPYNGAIAGLELDDLDGDGRLELATLMSGENVYVLDAETLQIEATIAGTFTSMRANPGTHTLELGDSDGKLSAYRWNGASYSRLDSRVYSAAAIDGFDRLKGNLFTLGTDGILELIKGKRALWESLSYGFPIGVRTVRSSSGDLVTTSGYAILGFEE